MEQETRMRNAGGTGDLILEFLYCTMLCYVLFLSLACAHITLGEKERHFSQNP